MGGAICRSTTLHAIVQRLPEAHSVVEIDMLPGQVDQQLTAVGVKCDIRRGQGVEAPPPALPRLHVGDVARRKVGNAAGVGRVAGVA